MYTAFSSSVAIFESTGCHLGLTVWEGRFAQDATILASPTFVDHTPITC